jgi:hypothetical protein
MYLVFAQQIKKGITPKNPLQKAVMGAGLKVQGTGEAKTAKRQDRSV